MNTAAIKNYAIQARLNFRKLVTEKLNSLGIKADGTSAPTQDAGGAIVINGMPFPASIRQQRNQLLALVKREGFEHVVEAMAYTLFNRFCALRFMEVHDYLPQRVFTSSTGGDTPDLLANAIDAIGYLGLDSAKAAQLREMKLRGDQDQELYKQLILAQCNALAKPMPFLFEPAKDMTELLMPDNLLHSDSVVRDLVAGVPEQDWQEIEIVGWLYQFYISERKDQVIGNVQSKEDIPAATQIFTPEWIVQYMVDNSLGRLWLEVEPNSGLAGSMDYYIDTAEANPDFVPPKHEHLKSPEDITLIDPACGSGHILVYAFDLLFRIYEQRGYVARDIPALILKHNLYGIDIDGRAAQLASFALTMKARSKDRRFLDRGVLPQILEIVESNGIEVDQLFATGGTSETVSPFADPTKLIQDDGLLAVQKSSASDLSRLRELVRPLVRFFHDAKSYGSLLRVPESLAKRLPAIRGEIARLAGGSGLFDRAAIGQLEVLVRQAGVLARQYDVCVANPPYMGSFYQELKDFAKFEYPGSKSDLYSMFIERNLAFLGCGGLVGMITIPNWMFLSSFERLRKRVLDLTSVVALCHNGRGVWGSDFGSCSFVLRNSPDSTFVGTYHRLFLAQGEVRSNTELEARFHDSSGFPIYHASPGNFKKIPGSPVAYWASDAVVECFEDAELLSMSANVCGGMDTANNDLFVRQWQETPLPTIGFDGGSEDADSSGNKKWFPYDKGGDFRKWFGNLSHVVNWKNSGHAIKAVKTTSGATRANIRNEDCFFRPAITWTYISSSFFGVRERDPGAIFDGRGPSLFSADTERPHQLAICAASLRLCSCGFWTQPSISQWVQFPTYRYRGNGHRKRKTLLRRVAGRLVPTGTPTNAPGTSRPSPS